MKIFTRHMALRFLGPFIYGLGVFALVVFLGDLFDKMNRLATTTASAWVIFQYLALQMPYWAIRVVPMATLLATLFCVTGFVASGEFVGVQAAGLRVRDFFHPILWMSLAIGILTFVAQETMLPACYSRARLLWQEKIHPEWEWEKYFDAVLIIGSDRFVTTTLFKVKEGSMERPVMDYYGSQGLIRQVDAQWARWDEAQGRWVFEQGVERFFDSSGKVSGEQAFKFLVSDLAIAPKKLIPRSKDPDEMNLRETFRYLDQLRQTGQSERPILVAIQSKISFPFANGILCALGIPIALRLRRAHRAISFLAALGVSFLYLWVIEIGRALGNAGALPALLAAWLPNLVFGCAAIWMYRRAEI